MPAARNRSSAEPTRAGTTHHDGMSVGWGVRVVMSAVLALSSTGCRTANTTTTIASGSPADARSAPAADFLTDELPGMADEDQRRAASAMQKAKKVKARHRDSPFRPPPRRP
jgi:hypothetical protein